MSTRVGYERLVDEEEGGPHEVCEPLFSCMRKGSASWGAGG